MARQTGHEAAAVNTPELRLRDMLHAAPQKFSVVQVIRLLHAFYGESMRLMDFVTQRVRIRPHLSLAFPPHDVVDLCYMDADCRPLRSPPPGDGPLMFMLTVSVLGLYGASSPLPTFYIEDLLDEERDDLSAGRDFLDIFNSRFYELLLHAGWFRYRPMNAIIEEVNVSLGDQLLALGGLLEISNTDLPKHCRELMPLGGLLSMYPRSATALRSFLRSCLGCECLVEEWVEGISSIPADQRCLLGATNSTLAEDSVIGSIIKNRSGRIRIYLLHLNHEGIVFYTSSAGRTRIFKLIDFFCMEPLDVDIVLSMDSECLDNARLGGSSTVLPADSVSGAFALLGQDTWIGRPPVPLSDTGDCVKEYGTIFIRGTRWQNNVS